METTYHFDEAGVDYDYRGDAKRHERVGGGTKRFSWDSDWGNVSEESGSGTLERMYVGNMAHVDGTNPASGAYTYYLQDHLGSTRFVYDQSKNLVGEFEYTPYGGSYLDGGPTDVTMRFTGHHWDSRPGLYFAPYRYYNPVAARWATRDPLGMVDGTNVYGYVRNAPSNYSDPLGLKCGNWWSDWLVPDKPRGNDFSQCCEEHDKCYGCDGFEQDKSQEDCDNQFLNCMKSVCQQHPEGSRKRRQCMAIAIAYGMAVAAWGERSFHAGRRCCENGHSSRPPVPMVPFP